MSIQLTPKELVTELDKFVVGHQNAKKAVSVALRNRWRRMQIKDENLQEEILPKNILLIGTTGIGKTEIARRLAKIVNAPFIKIEATKFTEVGYVGRDVEQIIRDLIEVSIQQSRKTMRAQYADVAKDLAVQKLVRMIKSTGLSEKSEYEIKRELLKGVWDDEEIELTMPDNYGYSSFDFSGSSKVLQFGEWLNRTFTDRALTSYLTVKEALESYAEYEADKLLDQNDVIAEALTNAERNGIVFLDEIDKICVSSNVKHANSEVSREGVQRDLLPLVEGTVISTKYGNIKTDHILFIASGAFYMSKPTDLLPELQGRFPIRVEMQPLTEADFISILQSTESSLLKQSAALLATENVELTFTDDAIFALAKYAVKINKEQENIGARRLHTLLERVVEEISFEASELKGQKIEIDGDYVNSKIGDLIASPDLARYIL